MHQRRDHEQQRLRELGVNQSLAGILETLLDHGVAEDAVCRRNVVGKEREDLGPHALLLRSLSWKEKDLCHGTSDYFMARCASVSARAAPARRRSRRG